VTLGLLDAARPGGRGPGGGRGGHWTWSANQRRLWLTLLDKRRGTDQPRALANLVVSVWLYWGEDFIPIRQLQRVLETYAEVRKSRRRHDYRSSARTLVSRIARPGAKARNKAALVDLLVDGAWNRALEDDLVKPLLLDVAGPADPGAQLDGPRAHLILAAEWAAVTKFQKLTDAHFRWARAFVLVTQADYALTRPELAADGRFGALHQPFDFEHIANTACQDVLFVLGMALTAPPAATVPEALQLRPWLEERAHLETKVALRQSPLLLPPGTAGDRLAVEVTIRIDPQPD